MLIKSHNLQNNKKKLVSKLFQVDQIKLIINYNWCFETNKIGKR